MLELFEFHRMLLSLLVRVLPTAAVFLTVLVSGRYAEQVAITVVPARSSLLYRLGTEPMAASQTGGLAQNFLLDRSHTFVALLTGLIKNLCGR